MLDRSQLHLATRCKRFSRTLFFDRYERDPLHLQFMLSRQPRSSAGGGWGQGRAASVRLAGPPAQAAPRQQRRRRRGGAQAKSRRLLRRDGNDAAPARHVGRTQNRPKQLPTASCARSSSRLRSLRKVVGWGPQRPPTLTANTTRWQCPRGRCRDAYASLLARGRGRALSGARRALGWGGSCLRHTLRATQPPASWQTLPTARSSGRAREGPRSSHRLRGANVTERVRHRAVWRERQR